MISSHVRRASAAFFFSSLSLVIAPVAAQQPVPLTVPSEPTVAQPIPPTVNSPDVNALSAPQSLSAPRRLVPTGPSSAVPAASAPTAPETRRTTGIEVDGLQALDVESVGTLGAANGGLGTDLWSGLRRTESLALLDRLPAGQMSPSLLELTRRFMLTQASAPITVDEDAPSLIAARAAHLMKLGLVDAARALISAAPTQNRPAGLDATDAMLNLLKFDNARVCGLTRKNQQSTSDFWQRFTIYCDVLDGNVDKVTFGLSLLRETAGDDPALSLLADAVLSGTTITLDEIANPHPIHIALSRIAKVTLPPSVAEATDPLVLYAIATYPNFQLGTRIEAAERAVSDGTLEAEALRRLYLEVSYSDADIADSLTRAQEIGGAAARALLYQAAVNNNIPVARGEIIISALALGREDGRYGASVLAFRPLIDRLPPSPEMVWFAPTGVRAYLALGEPVGTERWFALLRASAAVRDETKIALDRVRPLARVLGVGDRSVSVEDMLGAWRESLAGDPALSAASPVIPGILLALGDRIDPSIWVDPDTSGYASEPMPPAALWFQFRSEIERYQLRSLRRDQRPALLASSASLSNDLSSQERGIATGLVLTMRVLGGEGPESWSVPVLFEAVSALRTLGLVDPARRIALEYLLAAGL